MRSAAWLMLLAAVVGGCASSSPSVSAGSRSASPQFCGWAEVLVAQVPAAPAELEAPPVEGEPTPVVSMERLTDVADDLRVFASTADETAAHASSADAPHFLRMADFNRVVADVIGGSETLDTELIEPARRAADRVSAVLESSCGLEFDPVDGLAFVRAP